MNDCFSKVLTILLSPYPSTWVPAEYKVFTNIQETLLINQFNEAKLRKDENKEGENSKSGNIFLSLNLKFVYFVLYLMD